MLPKKISKKTNPKVKLNIKRPDETRLLDEKLLVEQKLPTSLRRALVAVLVLLFLGGGVASGYFYFLSRKTTPTQAPEIIVPEVAREPGPAASEPQSATSTEPEVVIEEVKILETPTGFLNVREGPGTNFAKVGEVKPGESYELVSEDPTKGWYQIQLDLTRTGWVIKQYAQVK